MHFPRRGLGLCCLLDVIRLFLDRLLLGVLLHWLFGTRLDLLLCPGRLLSLWLRRNMLTFQRLLLLYRLLGRLLRLRLLLYRLRLLLRCAPRLGLGCLGKVHATRILNWLLLLLLYGLLCRLLLCRLLLRLTPSLRLCLLLRLLRLLRLPPSRLSLLGRLLGERTADRCRTLLNVRLSSIANTGHVFDRLS